MSSDEKSLTETEQYDWDSTYKDESAPPWDSGLPAPELEEYWRQLAEDSTPHKVVEIGCGTGTNAVWLAKRGCEVTATEIAPTALQLAKERAHKANVQISFGTINICETLPAAQGSQDFAFDRGVYHVIPESLRPQFVQNLALSLKHGACWLTIAGSKDEPRDNPEIGPPQLSAIELIKHAEPLFEVLSLERTAFIIPDGKRFLAWKALFRRR